MHNARLVKIFLTGICFATGERSYMIAGAILYAVANMLDCCDGMVARMKGNGTQLGRMVDVFADIICGSFVYVGLGIGLTLVQEILDNHKFDFSLESEQGETTKFTIWF